MSEVKKTSGVPDGIRLNLITEFAEDKPALEQYDAWCSVKAAHYGLSVQQVRNVFARHLEQIEVGAKLQARSTAQKVAHAIGATLTDGLNVIQKGMRARKLILKTDRNGKTTIKRWVPDNDARISAAKELFRIHGAYAPEEIKVEHGLSEQLAELTEAQLKIRILELAKELEQDPEFSQTAKRLEAASSGTAGGAAGTEGTASREGLLLLADRVHEDG